MWVQVSLRLIARILLSFSSCMYTSPYNENDRTFYLQHATRSFPFVIQYKIHFPGGLWRWDSSDIQLRFSSLGWIDGLVAYHSITRSLNRSAASTGRGAPSDAGSTRVTSEAWLRQLTIQPSL
ncbi:hypothetical protein EDC01DRAFT_28989 [Geopyxis carbonaria]|nr:hypothetical protein EDC01DRAFT_28989 [Geopyxis carbonaria]